VTYHPFSSGERVCNIFYPTTDCQTVGDYVDIYLVGGESKIYVPEGDLAASLFDKEVFLQ
jgi:hypothetical protein